MWEVVPSRDEVRTYRHECAEVIEVDALAAFHPAAFARDFGVCLDGVDHGGRVDFDRFGLLDNAFESLADVLAALLGKSAGVGVPIDTVAGQSVLIGDARGIAPAEEIPFDVVALGVMADLAFLLVLIEIGVLSRERGTGSPPSHPVFRNMDSLWHCSSISCRSSRVNSMRGCSKQRIFLPKFIAACRSFLPS